MLTARSLTPAPGKLRQSPGRAGGKKKCLCESRDHRGARGPANIYSNRSDVFAGTCFREKLTAGGFRRGRVIRRNAAEGFLQLARCRGCQPPAPIPRGGTHSRGGKNLWKRMDVGVPTAFLAFSLGPCMVRSITRALREGDIDQAWSPPRKVWALEVVWQPCAWFPVAKGFLFVFLNDFSGACFSKVSCSPSPRGIAQHAGMLQLQGKITQHLKWSERGYCSCEQEVFWGGGYVTGARWVKLGWPQASPQSHPCRVREDVWIPMVSWRLTAVGVPAAPFGLASGGEVVARLSGGLGLPGRGEQAPHCATKTARWPISMEGLTTRFCQLSTSARAKFTQ